MQNQKYNVVLFLFLGFERVSSFGTIVKPLTFQSTAPYIRAPCNLISICANNKRLSPVWDVGVRLLAKESNDDGDEAENLGMQKAFESLNELSELDLSDDSALDLAIEQKKNKKKSNERINTDAPEEELKLYGDMYAELTEKGDDQIYGDLLSELGGTKSEVEAEPSLIEPLEDIDDIGDVFTEESQDEFMNRAIAEAMKEAKEASPQELSDNILSDKEMMKEIEKVFDEANKKLMETVEDIRKEQTQMSKESAEARAEAMKDDEIRLAEAEGSISRLVGKVSEEKLAVESAIQDLERAKAEMNSDPLVKVANLRSAGFAKQGAFVLSLLFTVRSLTDVLLILGPDSQSHAIAAVVQAGLALVFALVFFL